MNPASILWPLYVDLDAPASWSRPRRAKRQWEREDDFIILNP
jgi:hypothetical protein